MSISLGSQRKEDEDGEDIRITEQLDIGFEDLYYTVKTGLFRREEKQILGGITGEFRAGELSAIIGPSGAGKSTLLDLLAGYTTKNVSGDVTINGCPRNAKLFRRQSAYIMQDHNLQPLLTVLEAMYFSANLKIGDEMSQLSKKARIRELLVHLGLDEVKKTHTGKLSGGQRKRLAIALELVNNPPVMFFDEPSSGLDSSMSTQVINLLKKLAAEGRTVICTIHQPSALLFDKFDHLYTIAGGFCIYTGSGLNIIPYLSSFGLNCPEFHNKADYLLEIATNDYGYQNERLMKKVLNGKNIEFRKSEKIIRPNRFEIQEVSISAEMADFATKRNFRLAFGTPKYCKRDERYSTSFLRQFWLLMTRTFLILKRDKSLTSMRFLIHCLIAPMIGIMYFGIGNDAKRVFDNFNYIFFSIMFLMYTAFSSMTMAFPLELSIIKREHFNRWYSLRAYYVAMTLADVPIQVACTMAYVLITYFMTSQPLESFRLGMFITICVMVCLVAQGLGLVVGAIFDVKEGAIFGPFFISPFLIFSGFFIHMSDASPMLHWLFHISFLKYATDGAVQAIFGYDRSKMECDEMYCHFLLPKKFMQEIDMLNGNYLQAIFFLASMFLVFRVAAFYIMRFRLKFTR